ncbi:MAG: hypothetical protein R3C68_05550 [Myxococcota bacterium]
MLQVRFSEIEQLNATLEAKVEERTQELRVASTKLEASLARQVELDRQNTILYEYFA